MTFGHNKANSSNEILIRNKFSCRFASIACRRSARSRGRSAAVHYRYVLTRWRPHGASLGAVELAVAMHYVFDTPNDRLVWDVGHQAYAHKILTGRRDDLHTIKQYGGLSGFLRRDESEYDTFGAGHASTSLSAALGMAVARDKKGEDFHVCAMIGDSSVAGGMAMEAINQAGHLKSRLVVLLNDNGMSIAPAVGSINGYLNRIKEAQSYQHLKEEIGDVRERSRYRRIASPRS